MILKGLIEEGLIKMDPNNYKDIIDLLISQSMLDGNPKKNIIEIKRVKYVKHYHSEPEYRIDYKVLDDYGIVKSLMYLSSRVSANLDKNIERYIDSYIYTSIRDKKLGSLGIIN
jgi:hypothetical protein